MEFKMHIFVFILLIVAVWSDPGDSLDTSIKIDTHDIFVDMDTQKKDSFDSHADRFELKTKPISSESKNIINKKKIDQIKAIATDMVIKVHDLTANNAKTIIINPENDIALIINNRLNRIVGLSSVIVQERYINQYKRAQRTLNSYVRSQKYLHKETNIELNFNDTKEFKLHKMLQNVRSKLEDIISGIFKNYAPQSKEERITIRIEKSKYETFPTRNEYNQFKDLFIKIRKNIDAMTDRNLYRTYENAERIYKIHDESKQIYLKQEEKIKNNLNLARMVSQPQCMKLLKEALDSFNKNVKSWTSKKATDGRAKYIQEYMTKKQKKNMIKKEWNKLFKKARQKSLNKRLDMISGREILNKFNAELQHDSRWC